MLHVGAVNTYAKSTDSASAVTARTLSKVASGVLLDGVVGVSGVVAQAKAMRHSNGTVFRSSAGTTIARLKIQGRYRSANVPGQHDDQHCRCRHALPAPGDHVLDRPARLRARA